MNYFEKHLFSKLQLHEPPDENLGLVITIPCFNETGLLQTLDSLEKCESTSCGTEVIIHVNSSVTSSREILLQNHQTVEKFHEWNTGRRLKYFLLQSPALTEKHAGVGLARKIAMDEAAARFQKAGNVKGVIVCLDADCLVDQNYLTEIEKHFELNHDHAGASIYFEHPLSGDLFDQKVYNSIVNYELFLRYYILALKWCGFPYAFHTVGSAMAVRSDAYTKVGGMNRKKAGEDFYFLHKVFPFGKFNTVTSTRVIPSPRLSGRVPFGTGADISKQLQRPGIAYLTYNFQSFIELKNFFHLIPEFYSEKFNPEKLSPAMRTFLEKDDFAAIIAEIKTHTSDKKAFRKRFFRSFDGFKILKFVHFSRDHYYPDEEITYTVKKSMEAINIEYNVSTKAEMLILLRKLEKGESF